MLSGLAGRSVVFPEEFRLRALSYYVWGPDRTAANLMAHALAAHADPAFCWMSVREDPRRTTADETWMARLLPPSRRLAAVGAEELRPGEPVAPAVLWTVIRPDNPARETERLVDFLRMPERFRAAMEAVEPGTGLRLVVVANTDRIRAYYPADPEAIGALNALWTERGISVVGTSVPPAFPGRFGFDVVLRVEVGSPDDRRYGTLTVEKGLGGGRFQSGQSIPLFTLAPYQRSLSAYRAPSV